MKKICDYLKNPETIILGLGRRGLLNFLTDKQYLDIVYRMTFDRKLDLSKPVTFNEKLQWLKINDHNPLYVQLVDKATVKEYVEKMIGAEYIIPTIGRWSSVEDIDFDGLPDKFVLKCNHDSGGVVVCKDKNTLDIISAKNKLDKCMNINGFNYGREWPYKNVKPCIIAESYIENESLGDLRDYKFFCFSGKVRCFKIDYDRFTKHKANYYDPEGNLLPFTEVSFSVDVRPDIELPKALNKMMYLSEKLSAGFSFVRVDFYETDEKIYFGEMTFYPASGLGKFTLDEWDYKLGEWLNLNNNMHNY